MQEPKYVSQAQHEIKRQLYRENKFLKLTWYKYDSYRTVFLIFRNPVFLAAAFNKDLQVYVSSF